MVYDAKLKTLKWKWGQDFPVKKKHRISLCTTNMGRMIDSQFTLAKNIENNRDYDNVEFILLDYSSRDGLGDWVKSDMMKYIDEGILNYYRVEGYEHYQLSHSKNIAFKLASGDIVMNVDADNYVPSGFVTLINKLASLTDEKVVFAANHSRLRGMLGFHKQDFVDILGGYSEDMYGYAPCDRDIYNRAIIKGFTFIYFGHNKRIWYDNLEDGEEYNHPPRETNFPYRIKEIGNGYSFRMNRLLCAVNIFLGKITANEGREWGRANVVKNFSEKIIVGDDLNG
jgi:glycosyltransferase involved in cell wall biosynthesis